MQFHWIKIIQIYYIYSLMYKKYLEKKKERDLEKQLMQTVFYVQCFYKRAIKDRQINFRYRQIRTCGLSLRHYYSISQTNIQSQAEKVFMYLIHKARWRMKIQQGFKDISSNALIIQCKWRVFLAIKLRRYKETL